MVSCSVILINLVWILLFQRGLGMCGQSPDPGSCFQNKRRWYFNPISKTCQAFVWGGCGGTAPFNSFAACLAARCASPKLPACKKLPRQGNCSGTIRGWFYDRYTRKCRRYRFRGCSPAPFRTKQQCNNANCARATPTPTPYPERIRCTLIPDAGPCTQSKVRWYYDYDALICRSFDWGGCLGVVPFQTAAECFVTNC